ncbi:hypothetical protein [Paracoccus sp. SCSIO 75233]|uniref:hypothetical protein n=1 Tax=Paracoccus sp. SCSIO 75233 TaxID=3017782 RepID=UPI0022F029B5|nr:hypothetical protein [Paracoccus sp. SCSIO 75233]WBU52064.1 hypothetical protein PAF12_09445 [Paracoccus sp. SCSIO 75233]
MEDQFFGSGWCASSGDGSIYVRAAKATDVESFSQALNKNRNYNILRGFYQIDVVNRFREYQP